MKKSVQFILRREDPFDNDNSGSWDNEDINTLYAKRVFEGIITNIEQDEDGNLSLVGSEKSLINYDIVSHIDGYCYVRTIEKEPGRYHEYWREPNENEMTELINILKDLYTDQGSVSLINEDIIYQSYITKKRDSKINSIIDVK